MLGVIASAMATTTGIPTSAQSALTVSTTTATPVRVVTLFRMRKQWVITAEGTASVQQVSTGKTILAKTVTMLGTQKAAATTSWTTASAQATTTGMRSSARSVPTGNSMTAAPVSHAVELRT